MKNTSRIINARTSGIGVLCINENKEGFLHYINKYSTEEVDVEQDYELVTKPIYKKALAFCQKNNINLIHY